MSDTAIATNSSQSAQALVGISPFRMAQMLLIIQNHIEQGVEPEEARQLLNVSDAEFDALVDYFYRTREQTNRGKSADRWFINFATRMAAISRELKKEVKQSIEWDGKSGKKGLLVLDGRNRVMAFEKMAEIEMNIMKVGQQLGVIPKAPERSQVLVGIAYADLSPQQLLELLEKETRETEELWARYGSKDIYGNPKARVVDVEIETKPAQAKQESTKGVLDPPQLSDRRKPAFARGGQAKVAGAQRVRAVRRKA